MAGPCLAQKYVIGLESAKAGITAMQGVIFEKQIHWLQVNCPVRSTGINISSNLRFCPRPKLGCEVCSPAKSLTFSGLKENPLLGKKLQS